MKLVVHLRRVAAALGRRACVCRRDARLCVYSTSRLPNVVVLLFFMCVPCGMYSLVAVAVLFLLLLLLLLVLSSLCAERLFAHARGHWVSHL